MIKQLIKAFLPLAVLIALPLILRREPAKEILTNEFPLELSVFLNNIDEFHQLQVMLGAPVGIELSEEVYDKFCTSCIDFIALSLEN